MLSETSLWPPGMRQIKAKPITTLTLSFFLPGAAPHPGPARRPHQYLCRAHPVGRGRIYRPRAAGNEIGPSQGALGTDLRGSESPPGWQFRLRATGGSLGFLGAQKVLGLGWPEAEEGKGVLCHFTKSGDLYVFRSLTCEKVPRDHVLKSRWRKRMIYRAAGRLQERYLS